MSGGATLYPYDTIVYITDTIDGIGYQASGVLIAPNEVLTASHVVYSSQNGTATNIEVTPGYEYGQSPYGTVAGTKIHYNLIQDPNDTITTAESQYDYAVIHLATPFATAGTMGIESNYPGGLVKVSGYPGVDDGEQITQTEDLSVNPYYTVYQGLSSMSPGASGGPVWIEGTAGPEVIGLVSAWNGTIGTFAQITTAAFDTIESWVAEDEAACIVTGTRVATERGDVPVEELRVGDVVLTNGAGAVPVAWIGHRTVDCRRHRDPTHVQPIRVAQGAFGPGRPRRDLLLSPDHAIFVAGRLVPVRYLVNGATITQENWDRVTYWHVELPHHDVMFADGLAVETYLDTGNRACFDNGGASVVLHPNFAEHVWQSASCAPLLRDGAHLAAIRRRLHARALALGHTLTTQPDLTVLGGDSELPVHVEGRHWRVFLPPGATQVRLRSRIWVPAENCPTETDTRRLGVAVARIWLDGRAVSLDSPGFADGWHAPEAGWRWTDGDATLAMEGVRMLTFELAMTGSYWCAPPTVGTNSRRVDKRSAVHRFRLV